MVLLARPNPTEDHVGVELVGVNPSPTKGSVLPSIARDETYRIATVPGHRDREGDGTGSEDRKQQMA